jgi:nuclear RNA export factor
LKWDGPDEATQLYNLQNKDGQLSFQGIQITMRYYYPKVSFAPTTNRQESSSFIPMLTSLIKSRYNPSAKFLDLSAINKDPDFSKSSCTGFRESSRFPKFGLVLCKCIQSICPDVETISFADNGIRHLDFFSSLHDRVPNLLNLSFENNNLLVYKDLESMNGLKLMNLRELVLLKNPIRERELGKTGNDLLFASNVKKLFPSIIMLDMHTIPDSAVNLEIPKDIPPSSVGFLDSAVTATTCTQFLEAYYTCFDSGDRSRLSPYYDEDSIFSLSVNLVVPGTSSNPLSKSNKMLFEGFMEHDHNLDRVKHISYRKEKNYKGDLKIIKVLKSLPRTIHPIHESPEKQLFIMDAYQNSGMFLFIHLSGEFTCNVHFISNLVFINVF